MDDQIVSKAAFARELDASPARVTQMIAAGLPIRPDGMLERLAALQWIASNVSARGWSNARRGKPSLPERVRVILAQMGMAFSSPDGRGKRKGRRQRVAGACKTLPLSPAPAAAETAEPIVADPGNMDALLLRSKTDLEKLRIAEQWRSARLDNDVRQGKLIPADEAEAYYEALFRDQAQALLNWPSTIAMEMAAELGVDDHLLLIVLDKRIRAYMRERCNAPIPPSEKAMRSAVLEDLKPIKSKENEQAYEIKSAGPAGNK